MKKILVLVAMSATIFSADAQTKFGFKGGLNFSTLAGKDVDAGDFNSQVGFYIGGTVNISAGNHFSVQPELLFSNKGYSFSELGATRTVKFNYVALPAIARYTTSSGFYAEAGPSLSFLLTARTTSQSVGNPDVKDAFKSTAFSLGVGMGYDFKSGLSIGTRYNTGIGSISENSNYDIKFNILRIGLAWSFDKGEKKQKK